MSERIERRRSRRIEPPRPGNAIEAAGELICIARYMSKAPGVEEPDRRRWRVFAATLARWRDELIRRMGSV